MSGVAVTNTAKTQTTPRIVVSTRDVQQFAGDAVAVGVFRDGDQLEGPAAALDHALAGVIAGLIASGEVTGNADEVTILHTLGKIDLGCIAIIGQGAHARFSADRVRRSAAIACRALRKTGARQVGLALAGAESGVNLAQAARAAAEGALLGLYAFKEYKQSSATAASNGHAPRQIDSITILGRGREPALRAAVRRGCILGESTNFARDLGNEPANVLTPSELARRAEQMAQAVGLECETLGPEEMRRMGMGALLGVASGSAEPPRLIILRYRGSAKQQPGLGLVGKGITFDSGGISLKPADRMDEMKMDMCGGAAVIGAMRAIALLKPPINVTGLVPTTENMPGGKAYRPGDILRASNGKTIEILNTDAEGRLALADALSHAVRLGLSPIVDAATLTGAIVVALGHVRAGLFSNDEALTRTVQQAADASGERVWAMPMDPDYDDLIHSEIADIKQVGGRWGGAIAAAKVLSHFVGETPWAHLDIAGVNSKDAPGPDAEKGATGSGVRLFAELADMLATPHH